MFHVMRQVSTRPYNAHLRLRPPEYRVKSAIFGGVIDFAEGSAIFGC